MSIKTEEAFYQINPFRNLNQKQAKMHRKKKIKNLIINDIYNT